MGDGMDVSNVLGRFPAACLLSFAMNIAPGCSPQNDAIWQQRAELEAFGRGRMFDVKSLQRKR